MTWRRPHSKLRHSRHRSQEIDLSEPFEIIPDPNYHRKPYQVPQHGFYTAKEILENIEYGQRMISFFMMKDGKFIQALSGGHEEGWKNWLELLGRPQTSTEVSKLAREEHIAALTGYSGGASPEIGLVFYGDITAAQQASIDRLSRSATVVVDHWKA